MKKKWYKKKIDWTGELCKKTTRHHAHLSLCAKPKKTKDAKSRKWPKTTIWVIFWRFRDQILQIANFSEKKFSLKLKLILITNFRPKTIVWAVFWEKYQSVWFWANLETFSGISPNQDFFSKIRLCNSSTFRVP